MGQSAKGFANTHLASPADFAGANDVITNPAKKKSSWDRIRSNVLLNFDYSNCNTPFVLNKLLFSVNGREGH